MATEEQRDRMGPQAQGLGSTERKGRWTEQAVSFSPSQGDRVIGVSFSSSLIEASLRLWDKESEHSPESYF